MSFFLLPGISNSMQPLFDLLDDDQDVAAQAGVPRGPATPMRPTSTAAEAAPTVAQFLVPAPPPVTRLRTTQRVGDRVAGPNEVEQLRHRVRVARVTLDSLELDMTPDALPRSLRRRIDVRLTPLRRLQTKMVELAEPDHIPASEQMLLRRCLDHHDRAVRAMQRLAQEAPTAFAHILREEEGVIHGARGVADRFPRPTSGRDTRLDGFNQARSQLATAQTLPDCAEAMLNLRQELALLRAAVTDTPVQAPASTGKSEELRTPPKA